MSMMRGASPAFASKFAGRLSVQLGNAIFSFVVAEAALAYSNPHPIHVESRLWTHFAVWWMIGIMHFLARMNGKHADPARYGRKKVPKYFGISPKSLGR